MTGKLVTAMICAASLLGVAYADSSAMEQTPDQDITNRVTRKLLETEGAAAARIHVSTTNGIVTLQGNVDTPSQALKALGDAGHVSGVVQVRNRLSVRM